MPVKIFDNHGFTLLEVLMALALSLVTVGVIYSIYTNQVKGQVVREDTLDMQQHARAAMGLIVQDINMAGYDPMHVNQDESQLNNFDGITYHPTELVMRADLNGNGKIADSNEFVRFSHDKDSLTLRRDTGGGRQPLAEHIEAFSIVYFNRDGQRTTDSRQIRQIGIEIKARTARPDPHNPRDDGYRTVTLRSRITPRNLGL